MRGSSNRVPRATGYARGVLGHAHDGWVAPGGTIRTGHRQTAPRKFETLPTPDARGLANSSGAREVKTSPACPVLSAPPDRGGGSSCRATDVGDAVCKGIPRLDLHAYGDGFDHRGSPLGYLDAARVDYVKNVAYSLAQKDKWSNEKVYDVDYANVSHAGAFVASLPRAQSTRAFAGRALNGEWTLRATNLSAVFLHYRCTSTSTSDWYRTCTDHASIVLEIGWST